MHTEVNSMCSVRATVVRKKTKYVIWNAARGTITRTNTKWRLMDLSSLEIYIFAVRCYLLNLQGLSVKEQPVNMPIKIKNFRGS